MSEPLPLPVVETVAVIGLGYVGLPLAVAFAGHAPVIGFDIDAERLATLRAGMDPNGEVEPAALACASHRLRFTADPGVLAEAQIYVVTVPTPVDEANRPDLGPLQAASRSIAEVLKRGDLVIYESTVYPGTTEEVCVPLLEQGSGLRCNDDFEVGYSPERINPGDRVHTLSTICKVTSGSSPRAARRVASLYRRIVTAGVHEAPSIRVAEAAKVIENTQRDVNIALMNELAMIFAKMGIDTREVLAAARSKWNFLPFQPGLVGGHCIGVDPYYLSYKATTVGYHPELILAARRINQRMGTYVAHELMRLMAVHRQSIVGARVLVLGITFKEDCPDLRNTRVLDIVRELQGCNAAVEVYDPVANAEDCRLQTGVVLCAHPRIHDYQAIVLAVPHSEFRQSDWFERRHPEALVYDVKGVLPAAIGVYRL
ncbi:MAG: nucleotide sugar dehydrogenase [Xanthomonadales bacterium]|jgi:UDP-N-acetyl-D-galactosamine dehydrogenase|nr:nucleotide sugar dehydrogenase [Xanthomonadales bacterium]